MRSSRFLKEARSSNAVRFSLVVGTGLLAAAAGAFEEPQLSFTYRPGELTLAWPASATNWVLEQTTNLQTPVAWLPVPAEDYQTNGASLSYQAAVGEEHRFFHLRLPRPGAGGPLITGLLVAWPLDEGGGGVAQSAYGPDVSLSLSNTAWAAGRIGAGALAFNGGDVNAGGSRAVASRSGVALLPPAGQPFSLSLWFNPDALNTRWRTLLAHGAGAGNGWQVALGSPGLGTNWLAVVATGAGGSLSVTGQTLLLPGQWHQLTLTHDGAEGRVYLDATLLASGMGSWLRQDAPLWLGGGFGANDSFLGRLDELRIYTNALTAEAVALTGQWHFDENTGSNAADSSVLGHPANGIVPAAWVPGWRVAGVELSAGPVTITNAYADVLPPTGGAFSLSFWLRPHGLAAGESKLMSCGDSHQGWQMAVEVDGAAQTWLRWCATNHGGTLDLRAPVPLLGEVWTKLEMTFNGGVATVYVNGAKVHAASGAIQGSRAPLVLGGASGATNFNGVLDELKIYRCERAAAEIGPLAPAVWETVFINSTTNLVLPGTGPAGRSLTYTILATPAPTRGVLIYTPGSPVVTYHAGAQKGPDAFAYTVSDGEFTSPPATVILSVVKPHWLSPAGGTVAPLDGSSPEHAWAASPANVLADLWRTNNFYDAFCYAPGVYETIGWRYADRSTANPGCKHWGAGADGTNATILKLVDAWSAWGEGIIFSGFTENHVADGFEACHLHLDCNAENNPKYTRGEPVSWRLPLTTTGRVETVTLRWSDRTFYGNAPWGVGRASEFALATITYTNGLPLTNLLNLVSTGKVDVVSVGADAYEIQLQLNHRGSNVDFYGLKEIEVAGAEVSVPTATTEGGGPSRLDAAHSIMAAVDGSVGTSWASGPETQARLTFPLTPGSVVNQINLNWNCQTLLNGSRLGPASDFLIFARDDETGQLNAVPFVRGGRPAIGSETVLFTLPVVSSQVVLLLTNREPGVTCFSLKEVCFQNGYTVVPMRLPAATSYFDVSHSPLRALDRDPTTDWMGHVQGSVTAADVRGSNLKFSHLRVTGFGTTASRECFPLYVFAPQTPQGASNVVIEDCVFTQPAAVNRDGLTTVTLVGKGAGGLRNAVVRRCTVRGVKSQFAYSHGFSAVTVENCRVDDCGVAIYFEPEIGVLESVGLVTIRSNRFDNVTTGVSLFLHASARFDSIVCQDNEIVLSGGAVRGWGFVVADVSSPGPSGSITNVTLLNNIVRYADWIARPTVGDSGLYYTDMQNAVYGNNVIALGGVSSIRVRYYPGGQIPGTVPPEDCDHPGTGQPGPTTIPPSLDPLPAGYRRAWFGNRDLTGALTPVRYSEHGVDRSATQQQWP
jgi:hypothetical protein